MAVLLPGQLYADMIAAVSLAEDRLKALLLPAELSDQGIARTDHIRLSGPDRPALSRIGA